MNPKVYYFTRKLFKGAGMTWHHELRCLRVLDGDTRLQTLYNQYYKLGSIHVIEYHRGVSPEPYDLEWEMNSLHTRELALHPLNYKVILVDEKDQELK